MNETIKGRYYRRIGLSKFVNIISKNDVLYVYSRNFSNKSDCFVRFCNQSKAGKKVKYYRVINVCTVRNVMNYVNNMIKEKSYENETKLYRNSTLQELCTR